MILAVGHLCEAVRPGLHGHVGDCEIRMSLVVAEADGDVGNGMPVPRFVDEVGKHRADDDDVVVVVAAVQQRLAVPGRAFAQSVLAGRETVQSMVIQIEGPDLAAAPDDEKLSVEFEQ